MNKKQLGSLATKTRYTKPKKYTNQNAIIVYQLDTETLKGCSISFMRTMLNNVFDQV